MRSSARSVAPARCASSPPSRRRTPPSTRIADVGRWTGSAGNTQPWRFIVIRDQDVLRRLSEAGPPQTRALRSATAAIAIVLPVRDDHVTGDVYDDGRAAERLLIAASMLGLGAGIQWIRDDVLEAVRELLGLPPDRLVRTIIALGYPVRGRPPAEGGARRGAARRATRRSSASAGRGRAAATLRASRHRTARHPTRLTRGASPASAPRHAYTWQV